MGLFKKKNQKQAAAAAAAEQAAAPPANVDFSQLKVQLKCAKNRLALQKNKYQSNADKTEREAAMCLSQSQDNIAQTKAEQAIRDLLVVESMEILSVQCDLLLARHTLFTGTPEPIDRMPIELREAVCSLAYASGRVQVEELGNITNMMRAKYGAENMDMIVRGEGPFASNINASLMRKLSISIPEGYLVLSRLEDIAKRFDVQWNPPPEYEMLRSKSILDHRHNQQQPQATFTTMDIPGGAGNNMDGGFGGATIPGDPSGVPGGYPAYNLPGATVPGQAPGSEFAGQYSQPAPYNPGTAPNDDDLQARLRNL
mmetsp:Transcript_27866/g.109323  ORF Transcript_27866/g.109323 Transcript_27866/m.109323 type:complete len:313 (-) Transcript_27866:1663-2601(-)